MGSKQHGSTKPLAYEILLSTTYTFHLSPAPNSRCAQFQTSRSTPCSTLLEVLNRVTVYLTSQSIPIHVLSLTYRERYPAQGLLAHWPNVPNARAVESSEAEQASVMAGREECTAANSLAPPLVFAYYVTGHGLGHATRVAEIARHLVASNHEVHIVTEAPEFVFLNQIRSPKLQLRKALLDAGAVQSDALTVDRVASLEEYSRIAVVPRSSLLERETSWLRSINADIVVSDIVPIACKAASIVKIPCVCISNFSWDFIYSEYVAVAGHLHRNIVWQIAEDYSYAKVLIRLPGHCPMPAFRDVIDVPLVVRRVLKSRKQVREELGVAEEEKLLLFNFGGQDANWTLKNNYMPPGWKCLVCASASAQRIGSSYIQLDREAYTPDLIAASDCMLGKVGYGTVSEALAYKVPFVYVRRDYFNEEPFLRKMLEFHKAGVEMNRRDFFSGRWASYLLQAVALKPSYKAPLNGGEVAARLLEDAASGKVDTSQQLSGARRLRDAIVLGYQMQRAPGRDLDVPDWYTYTESHLGVLASLHSGSPEANKTVGIRSAPKTELVECQIIDGDSQELPDTAAFLKTLSSLKAEADAHVTDYLDQPHLHDRLAAAGLFCWKDDLYITRAPGRLDVMGGIADYSGSLVLQMPIREACHVAVQCNPTGKQPLWKHTAARQLAKRGHLEPAIQIVSFGSELSNRSPIFDMDLADFCDSAGNPITYEAARAYFDQDPSQKWAAYVAGTVLVLIRELDVHFKDGINILVSSAVPEGKGVSSSAALEVATMSAVAAVSGLKLAPRELAILCQKVENLVVGAPCGIMDQMASACGEADKLLAMVCQPAEVKGHVSIPSHVRFWGIDSGVRHSVGGADYGSVRIGAFMGRKLIQEAAANLLEQLVSSTDERATNDDKDSVELELITGESKLDYLCNMPPHRYESAYSRLLPDKVIGKNFVDRYGSHNDPVTSIDPKQQYAVKTPALHPIYENFRVEAFSVLLSATSGDAQLAALGELMYQSHYSYSNCGLGSDGTDRIVALVTQMQRQKQQRGGGVFGAKITGGGCGGTVCVLTRAGPESSDDILEIQQRYKDATGHLPYVFQGSSPGAGQFGYLRVRLASKNN